MRCHVCHHGYLGAGFDLDTRTKSKLRISSEVGSVTCASRCECYCKALSAATVPTPRSQCYNEVAARVSSDSGEVPQLLRDLARRARTWSARSRVTAAREHATLSVGARVATEGPPRDPPQSSRNVRRVRSTGNLGRVQRPSGGVVRARELREGRTATHCRRGSWLSEPEKDAKLCLFLDLRCGRKTRTGPRCDVRQGGST